MMKSQKRKRMTVSPTLIRTQYVESPKRQFIRLLCPGSSFHGIKPRGLVRGHQSPPSARSNIQLLQRTSGTSHAITMQLCIRRLACLALLAGVLAMTAAAEKKIIECCTQVGVAEVTAPILGYRIQRKNLPCVHAVIFKTAEGEVCSHWKQDWVFDKIKELEQVRRGKNNTAATPTTSSRKNNTAAAPTTSST
ncbi:hypothetical protein EPR50_G00123800 [Perca flavescens]|uniref:Chemokine interleukin-8-like domain-containing protein n=1 Tax=Perca flavescens TaxID=8167 RepID=A0A484CNS2_PERFV|nr:hypothetical protein EPR50_G00123800 [Perca flavescens]